MSNKTVTIEEFVNVKAGEAYRLFPFGKIVKGGKVREITPEFARTIQLPHFKRGTPQSGSLPVDNQRAYS